MLQARVSPDKARALALSPIVAEQRRINVFRLCLFGFDENRGNTLLASSKANKKRFAVASHPDADLAEICLPDGGHVRELDAVSLVVTMTSGLPGYGYAVFRNIKCSTEKRGARQASLLLISDYQGMDIFRPFLLDALNILMESPQWGNTEYLEKSLTVLRGALERAFSKSSSSSQRLTNIESQDETMVVELWHRAYRIRRIPFGLADFGGASLKDLVTIFKEKTIRIWYALMAEKRVVFVGQNHNASSLSSLVLGSVGLVGDLAEFIVPNLEPYLTLGAIGRIINKRSYVCGTNNAIFLSKPEWWDVCCDVTSGTVIEQDDSVSTSVSLNAGDSPTNLNGSASRKASRVLTSLRRRVSGSTHGQHSRSSSFPQVMSLPSASRVVLSGGVEMAFISRTLHDYSSQSDAWLRRSFHDFTLSFLNRVARRGGQVDIAMALVGLLPVPTPSLMQPRLSKFAEQFGQQSGLWKKYRAKQDAIWGGSSRTLGADGLAVANSAHLPSPVNGSFSEQAWAEETQFLGPSTTKPLAPYLIESIRGDRRQPTGFIRVDEGVSPSKRISWAHRTPRSSENEQPSPNTSFRENSSSPKRSSFRDKSQPCISPEANRADRWVQVRPKNGDAYFWNVETGETSWEDPDEALL